MLSPLPGSVQASSASPILENFDGACPNAKHDVSAAALRAVYEISTSSSEAIAHVISDDENEEICPAHAKKTAVLETDMQQVHQCRASSVVMP